jgi:hypothetical protein
MDDRRTNEARETGRAADAPSEAAGTAAGAAAGAVAGVAAGMGTIAAGPLGAIFGALAGAAVGASASQGVAEATYTPAYDEHYRALWEAAPGHPADASFETARPAYQFGHLAAAHPEYAGRDFHDAEPDLRRAWERDLAARYGSWESARTFVCDAYGHARSEGYGVRRDSAVIGSAGSAVDPVELERARAGLPSRPDTPEGDEPRFPSDLTATTGAELGGGRRTEEQPTEPPNAHPERVNFI